MRRGSDLLLAVTVAVAVLSLSSPALGGHSRPKDRGGQADQPGELNPPGVVPVGDAAEQTVVWTSMSSDRPMLYFELFGKSYMEGNNDVWALTRRLVALVSTEEEASFETIMRALVGMKIRAPQMYVNANAILMTSDERVRGMANSDIRELRPEQALSEPELAALAGILQGIAARRRSEQWKVSHDAADGPVDLLVVGGGPVGLVTAVEAAVAGMEVEVHEKRSKYTLTQYLAAEPSMRNPLHRFGVATTRSMILADYEYAMARLAALIGVAVKPRSEVVALCPREGGADGLHHAVYIDRSGHTGSDTWAVPTFSNRDALIADFCGENKGSTVGLKPTEVPTVSPRPYRLVVGADGAANSFARLMLDSEMTDTKSFATAQWLDLVRGVAVREGLVDLENPITGLCLIYKFQPVSGGHDSCPGSDVEQGYVKDLRLAGTVSWGDVVAPDSDDDKARVTQTMSRNMVAFNTAFVSHANFRGKPNQQCWAEIFLSGRGEDYLRSHLAYLEEGLDEPLTLKSLFEYGHQAHQQVQQQIAAALGRKGSLKKFAEQLEITDAQAKPGIVEAVTLNLRNRYKKAVSGKLLRRDITSAVRGVFSSPHEFAAKALASSVPNTEVANWMGVDENLAVDLARFGSRLQGADVAPFKFLVAWSAFEQHFRSAARPVGTMGQTALVVVGDALRDPYFVFGNGLNTALRHARSLVHHLRQVTTTDEAGAQRLQAQAGQFSADFSKNYCLEASSWFFINTRCMLSMSKEPMPTHVLTYKPDGKTPVNPMWSTPEFSLATNPTGMWMVKIMDGRVSTGRSLESYRGLDNAASSSDGMSLPKVACDRDTLKQYDDFLFGPESVRKKEAKFITKQWAYIEKQTKKNKDFDSNSVELRFGLPAAQYFSGFYQAISPESQELEFKKIVQRKKCECLNNLLNRCDANYAGSGPAQKFVSPEVLAKNQCSLDLGGRYVPPRAGLL